MSTGGKLWSDLTLMQELEDKLVSTGSIVDSKNMLVRGSESYTLPTNATFLDTEEPDKQPSGSTDKTKGEDDNDDELFGDVGGGKELGGEDEDAECFGIAAASFRAPKRKRGFSPTSHNSNKRHFERRNTKGLCFEKRFRRSRFDKPGPLLKEMSQSNASLASSTSSSMRKHIPAKKFVPKRLLANNFSNDVLFNAKFPPDAGEEELGNLMATALGEQFPQVTIYAVKAIGKELALDLFNQCKEIERSGGMLVNNQKRRRTPGGVFLQLLKTSPKISDQIKSDLFEFSRSIQREQEAQRLEARKIRDEQKKLEEQRQKKAEAEESAFPTAAEVYEKEMVEEGSTINTFEHLMGNGGRTVMENNDVANVKMA